jgi:hypothetical protein
MPRKTALHAKMIVTKPSTVPLVSSSMGTPVASKSKPRAKRSSAGFSSVLHSGGHEPQHNSDDRKHRRQRGRRLTTAMTAQTIKPINKRAAAMSPIKCQSVRAPRNPIVLRDSAISSSDIHATTRSPRFSRHRVPWANVPSHARWPWPSARRISRPYRAAFYAQWRRPLQRVSTRSILTHSLTPPSLALSHHGINHKQIGNDVPGGSLGNTFPSVRNTNGRR